MTGDIIRTKILTLFEDPGTVEAMCRWVERFFKGIEEQEGSCENAKRIFQRCKTREALIEWLQSGG